MVGNGSGGSTDLDRKSSKKKRAKNHPKQASKIEGGKSEKKEPNPVDIFCSMT